MTVDRTAFGGTGRRAEIAEAVRRDGFGPALDAHLTTILDQHRHLSPAQRAKELFGWLGADSSFVAEVGALGLAWSDALRAALDTVPTDVVRRAASDLTTPGHGGFAARLLDRLRAAARPAPHILEGDGTPMRYVRDETFRNWGRTVQNRPALTFIPRTKTGLCNLVRWAAEEQRTVRAAGYRHTWTDLYATDGEILVSMLPLDQVECLPASEPDIDPTDELQGITLVGHRERDGLTRALCRIGAATTNEQFRRWCLDEQGGAYQWTVPLNAIIVEITFGGSISTICHGAGRRQGSLSDLVTAIEFVNPRGELQTVDDPALLAAAAGCFGLLGIVTSVTLELDPMSYAVMQPAKPRLALAVPPPAGYPVPASVDMCGVTPADLDAARADFARRCESDYYAEWFWFAFRPDCWVNTWANNGRRADAVSYPSAVQTLIEETAEYLGELANESIFRLLPARWQAHILACFAMASMPERTIVTPLIDALHFRRGVQNMRVLDMEFAIPIPPCDDDPTQPDWSVCQRAWWDAVSIILERDDTPMRLALEMRVSGGSAATLAPQYGNTFGTCWIEVVTPATVPTAEWMSFLQDLADRWTSYTDPDGQPLLVRPHWAKQWQGIRFRGLEDTEYLRTVAYRDRIPEFAAALAEVAHQGGYTLADLPARFGNPLLTRALGDLASDPPARSRNRKQ